MSQTNEVKEFIQEVVAKSQIVVFSKSSCPFCIKTKELLKKSEFQNVSIEVIELDKMPTNQPKGPALQFVLREMTGQRTVPSVWVNGEFVGGNDTTQALYSSGELQKRLKAVSAQA